LFSGSLLFFISQISKQYWRQTWPQKCLTKTLHVLPFALLLGSMRVLSISVRLDDLISRLTAPPNVVIVLCTFTIAYITWIWGAVRSVNHELDGLWKEPFVT